jgi:DNA-directed RNA polymerase specialized sigma subunit
MTSKEFLNRGFYIDRRINSRLDQIERLKELSMKTSVTLSDMPGDPNHDKSKMEETIVKIVSLEEEINEDIKRLVEIKHEVIQAVNTVEDSHENLVLTRRYLNFWTWEDIAADMNCTVRHVHRLHSKALDDVRIEKCH